jgi:hypothetical protein
VTSKEKVRHQKGQEFLLEMPFWYFAGLNSQAGQSPWSCHPLIIEEERRALVEQIGRREGLYIDCLRVPLYHFGR